MPVGKRPPTIKCPFCEHERPDPDYMTGKELKAIRGMIGVARRWGGPLPVKRMAHLLKCSADTLYRWESKNAPIPRLTAAVARKLRDVARDRPERLPLPREWEAERQARELAKRKRRERSPNRKRDAA